MTDAFDGLWAEREEFLNVDKPSCLCDELGEDDCPIHSLKEFDIIDDEEAEEMSR